MCHVLWRPSFVAALIYIKPIGKSTYENWRKDHICKNYFQCQMMNRFHIHWMEQSTGMLEHCHYQVLHSKLMAYSVSKWVKLDPKYGPYNMDHIIYIIWSIKVDIRYSSLTWEQTAVVPVTTSVATQLEAMQGVSIFVTEAFPQINEFGKSIPGYLSERQALDIKCNEWFAKTPSR